MPAHAPRRWQQRVLLGVVWAVISLSLLASLGAATTNDASMTPTPASPATPKKFPGPRKLILDTDLGEFMDDSWALGYLVARPDLFDVRLVLTASHNTPARALIAARYLSEWGAGHIPVGVGHFEDDHVGLLAAYIQDFTLDSLRPGTGPRVHADGIAVAAQILMAEPPGSVMWLGIAPQRNFGELARRFPEAVARLGPSVAMFGSLASCWYDPSQLCAEYNARYDVAGSQTFLQAFASGLSTASETDSTTTTVPSTTADSSTNVDSAATTCASSSPSPPGLFSPHPAPHPASTASSPSSSSPEASSTAASMMKTPVSSSPFVPSPLYLVPLDACPVIPDDLWARLVAANRSSTVDPSADSKSDGINAMDGEGDDGINPLVRSLLATHCLSEGWDPRCEHSGRHTLVDPVAVWLAGQLPNLPELAAAEHIHLSINSTGFTIPLAIPAKESADSEDSVDASGVPRPALVITGWLPGGAERMFEEIVDSLVAFRLPRGGFNRPAPEAESLAAEELNEAVE